MDTSRSGVCLKKWLLIIVCCFFLLADHHILLSQMSSLLVRVIHGEIVFKMVSIVIASSSSFFKLAIWQGKIIIKWS